MAGGSTNHNRITGNFYAALNFTFRQQDYEAFMSNVRLWIHTKRIYTYPNVMIVAGEPEYFSNHTVPFQIPLLNLYNKVKFDEV